VHELPIAITLAGGSLIFAAFLVVFFFVLVFSFYTRKGSGISQRPYGDIDHSSGPEHPSELAHDITQEVSNWERGTEGHRRQRHREQPTPFDDQEVRAAIEAWRSAAEGGRLATGAPALGATRGPTDGATVVVFWDYTADESGAVAAALAELRAMRTVRETAFHLPLADTRALAWHAACAVEAARAQDQFWAAHDELLKRTRVDERAVSAVARLVKDADQFRHDLASGAGRGRILDHIQLAGSSGVHAVPTIFIHGLRYDSEPDASGLAAEIDRLAPIFGHGQPNRPK
jgi:hypothetical protein